MFIPWLVTFLYWQLLAYNMGYFSRWDRGDWDAICDSCGRKFKASKLKQRWDGLMVCQQDWEPRQPQDFVRGVPDPQLVPWVRDEATDTFIAITISSFNTFFSSITASLKIDVIYLFQTKLLSFLSSVVASLITVKVPAQTPSLNTLNSDAINNEILG